VISLSIAVPHCPWIPERVESMAKIRQALFVQDKYEWYAHVGQRIGFVAYKEFRDREPHYEWNVKLWRWSVEQRASHCLFLADDTVLGPHAISIVLAMLEAVPDQPIGLSSQHPSAPSVLRSGHHWYRCVSPWLVGWAYLLPKPLLAAFLRWHSQQSPALLRGNVSADDQLINMFLASIRCPTWHPLPTPFDHDLQIGSSLGHPIEAHGRREASTKAPWTLLPWRPGPEPCPPNPLRYEEHWKHRTSSAPPILECPPHEDSWRAWEEDQRHVGDFLEEERKT